MGDLAPDFPFYGPDEKRVPLNTVRGHVTVITIAEWQDRNLCSVARGVVALAEKYSSQDVDVKYIAVSEPTERLCDMKSNVVERCGLKSERVIGLCDSTARVRELYGIKAIPAYVVIGHDGRIAALGKLDGLEVVETALRKAAREYQMSLAAGPQND